MTLEILFIVSIINTLNINKLEKWTTTYGIDFWNKKVVKNEKKILKDFLKQDCCL